MLKNESTFEVGHKLFTDSRARAHTPSSAEGDRKGIYGNLADDSVGDWSFRPYGYPGLREWRLKGDENKLLTFAGNFRQSALGRALHAESAA